MLEAKDLLECARQLDLAERTRVPISPLIQAFPGIEASDAYRIQLINIEQRVRAGDPVVGHKVGLSSIAMQQMMGVDEPDYGHLLDGMRLDTDGPVPSDRYCQPRVEPEVGFILGADLPGEGCTESDVLAATEAVVPALELIDSRIADWKIALPDTIADNASSAGFAIGAERISPRDIDLTAIPVVLRRNGEVVGEGRSDAVLGNPVIAVAWLARTVARFGVRLRAGHLVLPGSLTRAIDIRPGDQFHAGFGELGSVSLGFAQSSQPSQSTQQTS
jgi:2-keto-4-pentenoate hydratase